MRRYFDAVNAGDCAALLAMTTDDFLFTTMARAPDWLQSEWGREAFSARVGRQRACGAHDAAITNSDTGITHEMPEFVVGSDGLLGVQLDTQHITLTMKDGSTQKLALRQSDCMRKSGDRWYSFLEHLSFAIDPATGKAITAF